MSLMEIVADLAGDALVHGIAPSTARGWVVVSLIAGLGLAVANGWGVFFQTDQPEWLAWWAVVGGPIALFLSVLHLVREPSDRLLSLSSIAVNTLALAFGILIVT